MATFYSQQMHWLRLRVGLRLRLLNGLDSPGSGVAVHIMCLFAHIHVQRESEGKEGGSKNRGRGNSERVFQRIDDNEFSRKGIRVNKIVFHGVQNSS